MAGVILIAAIHLVGWYIAYLDGRRAGEHRRRRNIIRTLIDSTHREADWALQFLKYRSYGIMRRTITIELKADLNDEQYEALKKALKASLRMIAATSSMIGNEPPSIVMHGRDFFTAPEEIEFDLTADDDEDY